LSGIGIHGWNMQDNGRGKDMLTFRQNLDDPYW
jgi:hypothetical protein